MTKAGLTGTFARKLTVDLVNDYGADPTGATSSSPAIAALLADIVHTTYSHQPVVIDVKAPSVGGFYKLTATIDLTEFWNLTLNVPGNYDFERQVVADPLVEHSLFEWHGAAGGIMVLCDYTYGLSIEGGALTLNGRNLADVGFALGATADGTSNVKYFRGDVSAKYCNDVGIRVGDLASNGPDVFPIHFGTALAQNCKNQGVRVNSGNAGVRFDQLTSTGNGAAPGVGQKGANLYVQAGEVSIGTYNSDGTPVTADICQDSGALVIAGAWSDVSQGRFLSAAGPINRCSLTGVRHFDASMTEANTPDSIEYSGTAPLVLNGCDLYGNVRVNAGNTSHVVDIGTKFRRANATFVGTAIDNRGYIGIGPAGGVDQGVNEARMSIGKPHRTDVGDTQPFTHWTATDRPARVLAVAGASGVVTETYNGWDIYRILTNAYYDGTNWRSVAAGPVAMVEFKATLATGGVRYYTAANAGSAGAVITWTETLAFFGAAPSTQKAANPDTSGATLAALETEVNQLKDVLRGYGLIAT